MSSKPREHSSEERPEPGRRRLWPRLATRTALLALPLASLLLLADPLGAGAAPQAALAAPALELQPEPARVQGVRPAPPRQKQEFGPDCMTAGCHDEVDDTPWVHAPVSIGSCATCHTEVGQPEEHRFELARPKETLCTYCHSPPAPEAHVHPAFMLSECTKCHRPHGGATNAMLVSDDGNALCGQCHAPHAPTSRAAGQKASPVTGRAPERKLGPDQRDSADPARARNDAGSAKPVGKAGTQDFAFVHEPVKEGKCLSCHNAHQSAQPKLLSFPGRKLCMQCHAEVIEAGLASTNYHAPIAEDCGRCHAAHGGADERLLKARPAELCIECHSAVHLALSKDSHVHGAVGSGDSCLNCHAGHHGETPALLNASAKEVCLECHDKQVTRPDGSLVMDMGKRIAAAKFVHDPVAKGECTSCHQPHSSSNRSLLAHDYPSALYSAYSRETYGTCIACHGAQMLEEERTAATGFREGDLNLHFVHVNQRKGRSCLLCHETHAGDLPKLMRATVAFGNWTLPIGYQQTDAGGSCGQSCHTPRDYSRDAAPPKARKKKQQDSPETPR